MKLDGTGEIWIGEGKVKLLEVLNQHGIPTEDALGNILAGCTMFYFDNYGLSRVWLQETDKGLKCSDTVLKMKEIYGVNYIPVKDKSDRGLFAYPLGNNTTLYITAQGTSDESVIISMSVAWPGFWGEAKR
jgi:hypothetical protein